MPRRKKDEVVVEETPMVSSTQTQTQVAGVATKTKLGIAVAFLGLAAVAAAAAGLAGKNCVSNNTTVVGDGTVRVCEQETIVTEWSGYGFTVSKNSSGTMRLFVNNPEKWIISDISTSSTIPSPSSVVLMRDVPKTFSLKDNALNITLTYLGMYKNYGMMSVEINVGGGSKPEANCVDTDGGKVFQTAGIVTLTDYDGNQGDSSDYCANTIYPVDTNMLFEYYCVDSSDFSSSSAFVGVGYASVTTTCEYGCMNGACIVSSTINTTTTTKTPELFINYLKEASINYGVKTKIATFSLTAGNGDANFYSIGLDNVSSTCKVSDWVLEDEVGKFFVTDKSTVGGFVYFPLPTMKYIVQKGETEKINLYANVPYEGVGDNDSCKIYFTIKDGKVGSENADVKNLPINVNLTVN